MTRSVSFFNMIVSLLKKWYGDFSKEELKKYLFLGFIFALIIGVYWTLRPMKDTIFCNMIIGFSKCAGRESREVFLAWAKVVSLLVLFPVVIGYSKLVDKFKKYHLLYVLGIIYTVLMFIFAIFFANPKWGLANTMASPTRLSGWVWYTFVESFGSLVIALFWAFVVDISTEKSAKRSFSLIVMIGQLGGILMPRYLNKIPRLLGTSNAAVVAICGFVILFITLMVKLFIRVTPKHQLEGYKAETEKMKEHAKEPGLMEGLKLLLSHKYLLGIFAIGAFFEFIVTVIDFNFKAMTFATFRHVSEATEYLGAYASAVNLVAFLFLLFGINNIQRWLGLTIALALVPIIMAVAVLTFKMYPVLNVLFYLVIAAKAVNYALNGPALKQLYIPTTEDVRYKAQAWIETFGSRTAKAGGSFANLTKSALGFPLYLTLTVYLSFGLLAAWFFIAIFLAKKCNKAINERTFVC